MRLKRIGLFMMLGLMLGLPARKTVGLGSAAGDDFRLRCQSKGVIQCFAFDRPDNVIPRLSPAADGQMHAIVDDSVKASGSGSLRFDIMPRLGANSSGSFALGFSREFGTGEELYVQWRQRFDREMLNHVFRHGEGWKQAILGGSGTRSCTANEIVVQNSYHRGFPQVYHSCGLKDSHYEPLTPVVPPSDFLLQDGTGCRYSNQKAAQCFRYLPDQWMTFQLHVKIGRWYENQSQNYHRDSVVELWVAEEGKPSVLVLSMPDYDLVHEGEGEKYGKIWLLPYNTDKDASEDHPVAHTWYAELIVSTARIPDPGVATPNPPDSLVAVETSSGVDLRWRSNSERETIFQVERCEGAMYECQASQAFTEVGKTPASVQSFLDKSAARSKRYAYRVRASNPSGHSAYTNPACNVPRPPSDLVAEAAESAISLRWSGNSRDETEQVVEGCTGRDCTTFVDLTHLPPGQSRYVHHGLTRGVTYRYRVRSANAAGSWTTWDKAGTAYTNTAAATAM